MCLFTRFGARKHSRPTRIFMSVLQSKGANHKGHEGTRRKPNTESFFLLSAYLRR